MDQTKNQSAQGNPISSLMADSFSGLPSLSHLDLSHCHISRWLANIGQENRLQQLMKTPNFRIEPDALSQSSLRWISLQGNQLQSLHPSFHPLLTRCMKIIFFNPWPLSEVFPQFNIGRQSLALRLSIGRPAQVFFFFGRY